MQEKTHAERMKSVLSKCSTFYNGSTEIWEQNKEFVQDIVNGKKILEIGCGYNGGLSRLLLSMGISDYIGIDINRTAIEQSKRLIPMGRFLWDDPIYIISSLEEPHIILSSHLMDDTIIPDRGYGRDLIRAISEKTQKGNHTIHWSGFYKDFYQYFLDSGFEDFRQGLTEQFRIYRKK